MDDRIAKPPYYRRLPIQRKMEFGMMTAVTQQAQDPPRVFKSHTRTARTFSVFTTTHGIALKHAAANRRAELPQPNAGRADGSVVPPVTVRGTFDFTTELRYVRGPCARKNCPTQGTAGAAAVADQGKRPTGTGCTELRKGRRAHERARARLYDVCEPRIPHRYSNKPSRTTL